MSWSETNPMEQKLLFIAEYLSGQRTITDLCRKYGISRKTGYKWIKRYQRVGVDGLQELSRKPQQCPFKIPFTLRKEIVEIRKTIRSKPGPKKILALLQSRHPNGQLPAETSIYNILRQEDLIDPRRRRAKVAAHPLPFEPVTDVNDVWSTDYKGQFKLLNGQWCYPLTTMDHQSRFLLECRALPGTTLLEAKRSFTRLFRKFGMPARIRSDNGVPFASIAAGGLSRLSVWWIKLGIVPERIEPGKPQQNGRHERMHRTLKAAATKPPAPSLEAQQKRFNHFIHEYNDIRPHESLGQTTPVSNYHASSRTFPARLPEISYPDFYTKLKVRQTGVVYWNSGQVYVSHLLADEYIGMEEIADGIWEVNFGPVKLGVFDVRKVKGNTVKYWSLNL